MFNPDFRTVNVTRYVSPLREGGSLPAIVEADDEFLYVLKFRGAGQGTKALVAEIIGGELARAMELKVPELVFMHLDDSFARLEPDEEIQDLLKFSVGLNLGVHYLSGSITYDPLISKADPLEASKVVILDSLINNIDRTHKNTNLLNWNRELWLIDHGASLYFHHSWTNWEKHANGTFPMIKDHVLLAKATKLEEAAEIIRSNINSTVFQNIVSVIPDDFLENENDPYAPAEKREIYQQFLTKKLANLDLLIKEITDARATRL